MGLERGKVALLLRSDVTFTCLPSPNPMSKLMILLAHLMCSVWVPGECCDILISWVKVVP